MTTRALQQLHHRFQSRDATANERLRLAMTAPQFSDQSGLLVKDYFLQLLEQLMALDMDDDVVESATVLFLTETGQIKAPDIKDTETNELVAAYQQVSALIEQQSWPTPEADFEGLRRLLMAIITKPHMVSILLTRQLILLRSAFKQQPESLEKLVAQTAGLFAPLANRLGIWQLKWEMEDLVFRYREPVAYQNIAKMLAEKRTAREAYLSTFLKRIKSSMSESEIKADVVGRPKHIFSIYRKMQKKGLEFKGLYDLRAARILVDTVEDCYRALGVIHSLWTPLPSEFDDYIAAPKPNGYRSLHTVVIGPERKTCEIQIRTWEMHHESEMGFAAHWRYKEGAAHDASFARKINGMRQLLESRDSYDAGEALLADFVEQGKDDERIYAFSPAGEVFDLQRGATALDFAYRVHTELGHQCKGAKVNGRITPLTRVLSNGDRVEVMRDKNGSPSRDWMNPQRGYLTTARARAKVRQWFRRAEYDQNVQAGKETFERETQRLGVEIDPAAVCKHFNVHNVDDLFAGIGLGEYSVAQVIRANQPPRGPDLPKPRKYRGDEPAGMTIHGVDNLMTKVAKCCQPVPGDPIVGYITKGRGVSIHKQTCTHMANLMQADDPHLIEVEWGRSAKAEVEVSIRLVAWDRKALLQDIATVLAHADTPLNDLSSQQQDGVRTVQFDIRVQDIAHLSEVMDRLRSVQNVTDVHRVVQ